LDKFRENKGSWIEHIERVVEDIPKVTVGYSVQEDVTERGKVTGERQPEWDEGPME